MIINYADKAVLKERNSIFLAGPTPRSTDIKSWRPEALKILNDLGFEGVVYVPEREIDDRTNGGPAQAMWEREALFNAKVIVFWIPRSFPDMPAFTSNIEFGYWIAKDKNKVIYGRPDNSIKNSYLDWLYKLETKRTPCSNLGDLLEKALELSF